MNKKTDTKTALIDLELIAYSHAAKAATTGTGLKSLVEMVEFSIQNIVNACHAQNYYLVVSGPQNFRKVLYPRYKAGRPEKPPLYKPLMVELELLNKGRWCMHPQIEADDLLGIMATNGRVTNPIICTIDKDLLSVPSWIYNWNKDDWPRQIRGPEANRNWLIQLLKGDPCDKIEGMKGIGDAKAEKLVDEYCKIFDNIDDIPEVAKSIYGEEGFSLDAWKKAVLLISIWRKPMPEPLLENELIREIVKTIDSL